MNKKILFATSFSVLFVLGALFFTEKRAEAQLGLTTPFGGKITRVKYCCNGLVLTITNTVNRRFGGDFFMSWVDIANPTVNYLNYQVFYGGSQNNVGMAAGVGFCVDIEAECEDSNPVQGGTILKIGTAFPG